MNDNSDYTMLILPPKAIEEQMRAWVEPTPGASLPSWGAHITLLNAFSPTQGLTAVQTIIEQVAAHFQPFTIRLDHAVSHTHLVRPHLQAVFLTSNPSENGHRESVRLQNELEVALAPLKRDLSQKIVFPDYYPHLSLTWGLPAMEADHLVEAAQRARLHIEFQVDKVWLLCFSPSLSEPKQVERVRAFALGVTAAGDKPK